MAIFLKLTSDRHDEFVIVSLEEFAKANSESPEVVKPVVALKAGETYTYCDIVEWEHVQRLPEIQSHWLSKRKSPAATRTEFLRRQSEDRIIAGTPGQPGEFFSQDLAAWVEYRDAQGIEEDAA